MIECRNQIWASFPSSLMHWQQGRARTYRAGQKQVCRYYRLSVPRTVDERAYGSLMRKEEFQDMMLNIRELVRE